jgi:hypothetical protein
MTDKSMTDQRTAPKRSRPEINLPYSMAAAKFGKEAAALMARKDSSVAGEAKRMSSEAFKWVIAYEVAEDPEDINTLPEFVAYLRKHSKVYLVARGGHWRGEELLDTIPPQVAARLEERARLICGQRASEARERGEDGFGDDEYDASNGGYTNGGNEASRALVWGGRDWGDGDGALQQALRDWLAVHPTADKRLAEVARVVIDQLARSTVE